MKQLTLTLMIFSAYFGLAYAGPTYSSKEMKQVAPPPCPQRYADNEWNISLWGTYAATGTEYAPNTSLADIVQSTTEGHTVYGTFDRYLGGDHAFGGGIDMLQIVKLLNAHATHVVALSISESTDAAIARIIVSDPDRVQELFNDHNIAFGVSELMVVELREVATQFIKILSTLLMAEVNVHFSYPLLTRPNGRAALAMHVDDSECASSVLIGEGFRLLSQSDISR